MLRRSFTIADAGFPHIRTLKENNVRKGFMTPEQYAQIMKHLPEHLKPIFQFAYRTGCRRGEILNLQWRNVNLADGMIRLEPGETKNDTGRTIPLSSDLVSTLEGLDRSTAYVFTKNGRRIRSIKDAWNKSCKSAGLPDMLFHDLRRTGVRNLSRAGVPEHVAMSISGHKTRAIFDRYNIVSELDAKEAMKKLEAHTTNLERQVDATLPGAIDKFMVSTDDPEPEK